MKKTVENTRFKPTEEITITGYQFALMSQALDDAFDALKVTTLPERLIYVDENGERLETEPSVEDLQSGKVRVFPNVYETFNPSNLQISYNGNITLPMLEAKRELFEIHQKGVDEDKVVTIQELVQFLEKPVITLDEES